MIKAFEVIGAWDFLGIEYALIKFTDDWYIGTLYGTIRKGEDPTGRSPFEVCFGYDSEQVCRSRAEQELLNLVHKATEENTGCEGQELINKTITAYNFIHHRIVQPYVYKRP